MPSQGTQHRAGKLKQANKKHKLRGTTKPSRDPKQPSGKVNSVKNASVSATTVQNGKQQRINRQKQLIQEKRLNSINNRRSLATVQGTLPITPPKIITLLPLNMNVNLGCFVEALLTSGKWTKQQALSNKNSNSSALKETNNRIDLYHGDSKSFYTFLAPTANPNEDKLFDIVECINVSDSVMLLCDYDELLVHRLIDENGDKVLEILQSFGSSGVILAFTPTSATNGKQFHANHILKQWKSEYNHLVGRLHTMLGEELKAIDIRDQTFIRSLQQESKHNLRWRNQRTYMLVDDITVNTPAIVSDGSPCTVAVRGLLRGAPMFLHSLVSLTNVGTGKITSIKRLNSHPYTLSKSKKVSSKGTESEGGDMQQQTTDYSEEVMVDSEKQDSLTMEASVDHNLLTGEQTWPQDHEMEGEEEGEEEINEDDGDDDDLSNCDNDEDFLSKLNKNRVEGKSKLLIANALSGNGTTVEIRSGKKDGEEEVDDDYVDDYNNMTARQRFARYRSLESMRSSYWHPKENLPPQYSKIFQFEDFKSLQKRLSNTIQQVEKLHLQQGLDGKNSQKKQQKIHRKRSTSVSISNNTTSADMEDGMEMDGDDEDHDNDVVDDVIMNDENDSASKYSYQNPNALIIPNTDDFIRSDVYVEIVIADVPYSQLTQKLNGLLTMFVLHANEQKLSICHYTVRRIKSPHGEEDEKERAQLDKVKSKEEVLFYCGFRGFWTKPVFSESNLNSDKHKFLRYLPRDGFTVASAIIPVNMTPTASVVILKRNVNAEASNTLSNSWQIIATGNALSTDPDRIMLKRIILSGNPIRVRKRTAVVKNMFFDPLDVRWFKPAELTTIHGLRGHIKESVGTHGLYKASFNAAITQNDMVKLVLYKRVYPKLPGDGVPFST